MPAPEHQPGHHPLPAARLRQRGIQCGLHGEPDLPTADLFTTALHRIELPLRDGELVIDATGLDFIDPNHKGMPTLPAGHQLDYLRRQVLTSRKHPRRPMGRLPPRRV